MSGRNYNTLKADNKNDIKYFAVLASGAIVTYYKYGAATPNNKTIFLEGRVITPAVPNGIAFTELEVNNLDIIGTGNLLYPMEDVRAFEEQADNADSDSSD